MGNDARSPPSDGTRYEPERVGMVLRRVLAQLAGDERVDLCDEPRADALAVEYLRQMAGGYFLLTCPLSRRAESGQPQRSAEPRLAGHHLSG